LGNFLDEDVEIIGLDARKENAFFWREVESFGVVTFGRAQWIAQEQCAKLLVHRAGNDEAFQVD